MERQVYVGFRATEAEARKVEELARQTKRSKSDVLRLLLEQAERADRPDVLLKEGEREHGQ